MQVYYLMMSYQHPKKRYLQQMLSEKGKDTYASNSSKKPEGPVGTGPVLYSQLSDHLLYCENKSQYPTDTIPKIICLMKKQMTEGIDCNNLQSESYTQADCGVEWASTEKGCHENNGKMISDEKAMSLKTHVDTSTTPYMSDNQPVTNFKESSVPLTCDIKPNHEQCRVVKYHHLPVYENMGHLRGTTACPPGSDGNGQSDTLGTRDVGPDTRDFGHITNLHSRSYERQSYCPFGKEKEGFEKHEGNNNFTSSHTMFDNCINQSVSEQEEKKRGEGINSVNLSLNNKFELSHIKVEGKEFEYESCDQGYVSIVHRPREGAGILPPLWDHLTGPIPKLPQILNDDGAKAPDYSGISQLLNMDLDENSMTETGKSKSPSKQDKQLFQESHSKHPGMSKWATGKVKRHSTKQRKERAVQKITMLGNQVCYVTTSGRNKGSGKEALPKHDCQICGDVAGGFHCGAYVCEACKKFYLRCLKSNSNAVFNCVKQKKCLISKDTRSHCQFCRFQKCKDLGMYKPGTEDDKQLKVDFKSIPCKVCEAPSSGFHFGAITCEGCKGFFRRMLKESIHRKFSCSGDGDCSISSANRTTCKTCRFEKCKLAGMKLAGTRLGRQSNSIKRSTLIDYNLNNKEAEDSPNEDKKDFTQDEPMICIEEESELEKTTTVKIDHDCTEVQTCFPEHQGRIEESSPVRYYQDNCSQKCPDADHEKKISSPESLHGIHVHDFNSKDVKPPLAQDIANNLPAMRDDTAVGGGSRGFQLDRMKKKALLDKLKQVQSAQSGMFSTFKESGSSLLNAYEDPRNSVRPECIGDDKKVVLNSTMTIPTTNNWFSKDGGILTKHFERNSLRQQDKERGVHKISNESQSETNLLPTHCESKSPEKRLANSVTCSRVLPRTSHKNPAKIPREFIPHKEIHHMGSGSSDPGGKMSTSQENSSINVSSGSLSRDVSNEADVISQSLSETFKAGHPPFAEGRVPTETYARELSGSQPLDWSRKNNQNRVTNKQTFPDHNICDFNFQNWPSLTSMKYSDVSTDEEEARTWSILETDPLQWLGVLTHDDDTISKIHSKIKASPPMVKLNRKLLSNGEWLIMTLCSAYENLDGIQNRPEKYVDIEYDFGMDRMNVAWSIFDLSFQHHAKYFLKFIKKIPGFRALPMADQVQLTKDTLYPIILIYHSRYFNAADKSHSWFQNTKDEIEYFRCYLPQLKALEHHFIFIGQIMHHIALTPTERSLLAALCVFSISEQQKLHAAKEIEEIKDFILNAFITYLDRLEKPDTTRLGILLARLPELQRANIEMLLVAAQVSCMCPNIQFKQLWQELYHKAKSKQLAANQA